MKRFEYKRVPAIVFATQDLGVRESVLNSFGKDGWELCTITIIGNRIRYAYFKREL